MIGSDARVDRMPDIYMRSLRHSTEYLAKLSEPKQII